MNAVVDILEPYIQDHIKTFDEDNLRDFLDIYIAQMKECDEDPSSSFYKDTGLDSLRTSIVDMFMAGSDTISSSLTWAILYMVHHPDIQQKVQEELDEAFKGHDMPTLSVDASATSYTRAVISECFRKTSLVYRALPHRATGNIKAGNYLIPKGSVLLTSLYNVHHDPKLWENPDVFDPSRFLDGKGNYVGNPNLSHFGIGKRFCLGERLAEKEFFLMFTGLLYQFKIERAPGTILPSYGVGVEPAVAILRGCPRYKVIMTSRH